MSSRTERGIKRNPPRWSAGGFLGGDALAPRHGNIPNKSLTGSQLRKFRSEVARLKALGLVSKRIDARSQKPTRYMREQVKKFSDVLAGKAKVVHVPKRIDAKRFEDIFRVKGKNVVVPVSKGEKAPRYIKKTGEIQGYVERNGQKYVKLYANRERLNPSDFPTGPNILYRIPFGGGGSAFTFDDVNELFKFMQPYEQGRNPYKDWQRYVEIIRIRGNRRDMEDDLGE